MKLSVSIALLSLGLACCTSRLDGEVEQLVSAKNRWQEFCPGETYTISYTRRGHHWDSDSNETVRVVGAVAVDPPTSKERPKVHGLTVRDMFDLVLQSLDPNDHIQVSVKYDEVKGAPAELSLEIDGTARTRYDFKINEISGCKGSGAAAQQ